MADRFPNGQGNTSEQTALHEGQWHARLARKLSPLGVWALSLGCIIGWGSFILPGTTFLPQAGPLGCAIALALAVVVMIVISLNYSFLIERYPVAGGEFAYVQDSYGPRHAFATSWMLGLCYLALVAQNATALGIVGRSLLGGIFQVGFLYSVAGYNVYAGELCVALAALVLFALLNIRGVNFAGIFQTVLVAALVGGVVVVVFAALCQMGASALVPEPAFSPTTTPAAGIIAVLAIAPFLFVGFDTIPQAAEEYRFSPTKARVIVVVSLIFGACIYAALTTLAAAVVPAGYATWSTYVDQAGNLEGVAAIPTFNAAQTLLGPVGLFVLGTAACGAILSGIVGFYLASSRLLFAMGRDGALPSWFSCVHERYRTPHHAILFVLGVAAIAPFFGRTVLGWLVDASALGAAVAYGYTSAVALRLALRENRRVTIVTGGAGAVFSMLFAVLLLVPIPGIDASFGLQSYVCLFVWLLLGVVFFATTRQRRIREGRGQ